ncbi:hypothetical protein F4778DRAFT_732579 [Xylariomycetidae sp. FL2044]|nr:hypothetical protein F4778DRAFT_732579 [Xylariomycetidae sp. FL2044]
MPINPGDRRGMAGYFAGYFSRPAPKKLGEGCRPGQAKRGDLCKLVEMEMQELLQDDPDNDDLEFIETEMNNLPAVKDAGYVLDTYYVSRCIAYYKSQGPRSIAGSSVRPRTPSESARDSASTSHFSHDSSKIVIDGDLEIQVKPPIPFKILTREGRPRYTMTGKILNGSQNFVSPRVAEECGYSRELGTRVNAVVMLLQEEQQCSLIVKAIDHDMFLTKECMLRFDSYRPDYDTSQYFHEESTEDISRTRSIRAGSSVRGRGEELRHVRQSSHRYNERVIEDDGDDDDDDDDDNIDRKQRALVSFMEAYADNERRIKERARRAKTESSIRR